MQFKVFSFNIVGSTMDVARSILLTVKEPFVVQATEQLKGRGRQGRRWISKPGNLFSTFVLPLQASQVHFISYTIALSVSETLVFLGLENVTLKWPNDVLCNGKKVAGILIETLQARGNELIIAVGIGINVFSFPEDTPYPATSLLENHIHIRANEMIPALINSISHFLKCLECYGWSYIRSKWLESRDSRHQSIVLRTEAKKGVHTLRGVFLDLDERGYLLLEVDGERKTFATGDMLF